jgi:hypothetical protein
MEQHVLDTIAGKQSCHRCLIDVEKMNIIYIQNRTFTTRCLKVRVNIGIQTVVTFLKFHGTTRIRRHCRKTTVLSCHRCLIDVEKNEHHLYTE